MSTPPQIRLDALAAALAELSREGDLEPLNVKGIAHDHLRLSGSGLLLRVPRQSQFALPPEDNLRYQAACFERAFPSGHTPRLEGVIRPRPGLPMGALLVEEIVGRPMQLPGDLPRSAEALAAIHCLPVPAPSERAPLADHSDPLTGTLGFIERQWVWREKTRLHPETLAQLEEEVAWARALAAGVHPPQPVTLVMTDSHPGNFLVEAGGRAVFVDLEKMLYGAPAIDLAHHTLYTSTTWDVDAAGVLSDDQTEAFHDAYLRRLPPDLSGAILPWIGPLRRLTWLRTVTWAIKWLALTQPPGPGEQRDEDWSATQMSPAYRAHVAAKVADFLSPVTMARLRREWIASS
ncbi:MAG TPA: aminoglycoside phosphotransferase family protein [Alphaproteobacteria bacterium]|nr:aminoglycoside phosphotransferase family protein [Alphaproteobacteria bacterium]